MVTVADHLSVAVVLVTGGSEVSSAVWAIRAGAGLASVTVTCAQHRVAVVTIGTPVTFVPSSVFPAVETGSGPLVALLSMSVTQALLTVGEAPVSCLAAIAPLAKRTLAAWALPSQLVTEPSDRTF